MIFYIGSQKSSSVTIEKIQHVFTRRLFIRCVGSYPIPEYEERLKLFGLDKLSVRISSIELVTLYKLSKGILIGPKFFRFSERLPYRMVLSPIRSSLIKNSFFHRSLYLWNKVIHSTTPDTISAFKRQIYHSLHSI